MKLLKKRLLTLTLCLLAVFTIMPALTASAAEDDRFDSLLGLDGKEPDNYAEMTANDPYNGGTRPFLMNAESELMLYMTKDNGNWHKMRWFDKWKGQTNNSSALDIDDAAGNFNSSGDYTSFGKLSYVESVAFDPFGTGRNDHAAYIGYDHDSYEFQIKVVDSSTGDVVAYTYVHADGAANSVFEGHTPHNWFAGNLLAITAGDYNGDGCDSLIIYIANDNQTYGLHQIDMQISGYLTISSTADQTLLHQQYVTESYGQNMAADAERENKLGCDLATGDFNGDGIDDLAVVSYLNGVRNDGIPNRGDKDYHNLNYGYYTPWLNVAYGSSWDSDNIFNNTNSGFVQLAKSAGTNSNGSLFTSVVAPGIAAGDVDGDGGDEIIVAGTKNTITKNSHNDDTQNAYGIDNAKWILMRLKADSDGKLATPEAGTSQTTFNEVAANEWIKNKTGGGHHRSPMMVETVAINGPGRAEHVFVGGSLFDMTAGAALVHTAGVFNSGEEDAGLESIDYHFIPSAAVGNFDGNDYGYEQIIYVLGMREGSEDDYWYKIGMIGGASYPEDGGSTSNFWDVCGPRIINNTGGDYGKRTILDITAVDRDDDGVMAKYSGSSYAYADPQVAAVLQMAPYFDEIDIGNDAGATTYSFTQTYEYGEGTNQSRSYSIGGSASLSALAVTVDVEAGYASDWSQSFERTLTTSYTDSFTAKAYDSVVLYRTPVIGYNYMIYDPDHESWSDGWSTENMITVTIPQKPSYVQMSVSDYNDFVDVYNSMMAEETGDYTPMKKIDLDYLGQEGNPYGYGTPFTNQLSLNQYSLGYNGGETSSVSTTGEATSTSIEQSNGFSFEISMEFGYSGAFVEATAGVNYSLEEMAGSSTTTTTSSETETGGTVQDLDLGYLMDEYSLPESVIRSFGFTWELGSNTIDLGVAGDNVLVIGYNVENVTAPVPPVTDLQASLENENTATLQWERPSVYPRYNAQYFNVYIKDKNNTYTKINEEPIEYGLGFDAEYTLNNLDSNTEYTYVVTSLNYDQKLESVWSNEAVFTTPKANMPLTLDYNEDQATIKVTHLGNVEIESGESVPEDTIVYVETAALDGYTITGVTLTQGDGEAQNITLTNGKFNFVIRDPSTITITTEKVVESSTISYQDQYTDANETVIGTVSAQTESGNAFGAEGAKVYGPVTFTAQPAEGYTLKEWKVTNASGEDVITAVGDTWTFYPYETSHEVTAVFVPVSDPEVSRTITVNAPTEGGGIEITDADGIVLTPDENGNIQVPRGAELTITAVPDSQYYTFLGWTDDFKEYKTQTSVTLLMPEDGLTIGAEFRADLLYQVTFGSESVDNGNGTVTASVDGTSINSGDEFAPGTQVDFAAEANDGSRILKWAVTEGTITTFVPVEDGYTQELKLEDEYTLESLKAKSHVDAYFKTIEKFDLTIPAAIENGTITITRDGQKVTPGADAIEFGDVLTITATPDWNYKLESLKVNGKDFTSGDTITVQGDIEISATFYEFTRDLIIAPLENGTVTVTKADGTEVKAGTDAIALDDVLTITATPNQRYFLDSLKVNGEYFTSGDTITVTDNISIEAIFKARSQSGGPTDPTPDEDYPAEIPENIPGGSITVNPDPAEEGETITLTPTPEDGQTLDSVTVTGPDGEEIPLKDNSDGTFSYTQPAGSVVIEATFTCDRSENCPSRGFSDLKSGAWYHDAIDYAVKHGLMKGTGTETFEPEATTSRAMIATILWRLADEPTAAEGNSFTDVAEGTWYTEAVAWASESGIVEGYGNGQFLPDGDITREEFATMLWRFAKAQGYDVSIGEDTNILSYADAADISEWAVPAMQWACGAGIIQGDEANLLDPQGNATRAQAAAMLQRVCLNIIQ